MVHPVRKHEAPSGLPIYYKGSDKNEGPLPAFFYFALSGEDSLGLDPYNQPVAFLNGAAIRSFSFSLPLHGEGMKNTEAMKRWAEALKEKNIIENFLNQCIENINFLINEEWINPEKIAVGGLSRGGFIATHLAAKEPSIKTILGYAPLVDLGVLNEFEDVNSHSHFDVAEKLIGKRIRYYIGNRDKRVETDVCYRFVRHLCDLSYENSLRSPPVELILFPSIGFKGHGTPPEIFKGGSDWLLKSI